MIEKETYYLRFTNFPAILERWLDRYADRKQYNQVINEFKKLAAQEHSYISVEEFGQFLKRCSEILNEPDFADHLALDTPPSVSQDSRAVLFMYYARSLRDWIRTVETMLPARGNMFRALLVPDENELGDEFIISVQPRMDVEQFPQLANYLAYDFTKLFAQLHPLSKGGLKRMQLLQDKPDHPYFLNDDMIEWNSTKFEIVIDKKMLDKPLRVPVSSVQTMLSEIFDYLIPKDTDPDDALRIQVEIAINLLMGTGRCNIEEVAVLLRNTAKRLQRALKKNDDTFSTILEDARRKAGRDMLTRTDVPIKHIAVVLDYSSNKSFALACKRWTGLSPRHYREASRKQGSLVEA